MIFQTQQKCRAGGFTILEIIIVVIIVGVLASLAIPSMQMMIERSRAVEGLRFLHSYRAAIETCRQANGGDSYNPTQCIGPDYIYHTSFSLSYSIINEINSHFNGVYITCNNVKPYVYCVGVWRSSYEMSNDPGTLLQQSFGSLAAIVPGPQSKISLCVDDNLKIVKIFGSGWYAGISN